MKYRIILGLCLLIPCVLLIGCQKRSTSGYTQITQEEAAEMMKKDDGHLILDVRTYEEYASGHIPGALCIPNETIGENMPEELPDKDQIILIYCRSGNRSRQAAQKLYDMGYTNIYEFGGINTWKGDIVEEDPAYEQGAPELNIEINDVQVYAVFGSDPTDKEFIAKLDNDTISIPLTEIPGARTGTLPWSFSAEMKEREVIPGNIVLEGDGSTITLCLEKETRNCFLLANIIGMTQNELKNMVKTGDTEMSLFLDWLDY